MSLSKGTSSIDLLDKGEAGRASTTVGQDIPESVSEIVPSVRAVSERKVFMVWYSLTVDSDEILEWDRERLELFDDMVI